MLPAIVYKLRFAQQGWVTFILHRMEVMLMKKFDFKDLMSFGMFLLALLTFIYLICH